MNELSPEQNKQLDSWASQRDSILLEIAAKKSESERLDVINKNLSDSNTEIENRIIKSEGRIQELVKKEEEFASRVSIPISKLISEKSQLQSENSVLLRERDSLMSQKENLAKDIVLAMQTYDLIHDKSILLEKMVEGVTRISSENLNVLDSFVGKLQVKISEILDVSTKNLDAHTVILNKIPELFVELRKKTLDRDIINKHK